MFLLSPIFSKHKDQLLNYLIHMIDIINLPTVQWDWQTDMWIMILIMSFSVSNRVWTCCHSTALTHVLVVLFFRIILILGRLGHRSGLGHDLCSVRGWNPVLSRSRHVLLFRVLFCMPRFQVSARWASVFSSIWQFETVMVVIISSLQQPLYSKIEIRVLWLGRWS